MTDPKPGIFHTPFLTPFASRLIHICVDLREIRAADAHPKIPQSPCGRRDTEAFTHLRGQPQNPREGRAACTKPEPKIVQKAPESMTPGLFLPLTASIIPTPSISRADTSVRLAVCSATALSRSPPGASAKPLQPWVIFVWASAQVSGKLVMAAKSRKGLTIV